MTNPTGLSPIRDNIIVLPTRTTDSTAGGIFIPEDSRERQETGRVVAVGPGVVNDSGQLIKPNIGVGAKVLYDINAGVDVEHNGLTYLIMPMKFVYCVLGEVSK